MRIPDFGLAGPVWLGHVSVGAEKARQVIALGDRPVAWLFLGQDYQELLKWEKALGAQFRRVSFSEDLAAAASELRQPFLELITKLGRRHNSLEWWTSRVSERNIFVSPLFLYCCYLHVGKRQIASAPEPVCIIGESWALLDSLAKEAAAMGRDLRWVSGPLAEWRRIANRHINMAVKGYRFLLAGIAASLTARQIKQTRPKTEPTGSRKSILLCTFVDESCLNKSGAFQDRYFPGLNAWLERHGYEVWTIPVLFAMNRSYRAAWEWFEGSQQQFLNPDEYYRLSDYLFALWVGRKQARIPRGRVFLGSTEVTLLFIEEKRRFVFDRGQLESTLAYRLPRRLAEDGFGPDIFISGYENMIPEKGMILGLRRFLPEVKIVGFQHGALYPLLLCNFVTAGEAEFAPIPDRVVCSGRFFQDTLVRAGLPSGRVVTGAALRYRHLWTPSHVQANRPQQDQEVLVPLPLAVESCAELLVKVADALGETGDVNVMLKPHPMMSHDAIVKVTGIRVLPPNFQIVQGGMAEWLPRARLLISLSSSVLHEALAAGVPVVVVGHETALDLNPLSWFNDMDRTCRTPEEIRKEALRILNLSSEELDRFRERAQEILRISFEPVTDAAIRMFVDALER